MFRYLDNTITGDSGGPLWTDSDLETNNGTLKNVAVLIGIVRNYINSITIMYNFFTRGLRECPAGYGTVVSDNINTMKTTFHLKGL